MSLETIGELYPCVVAEAEALGAVEGVACADAFGAEGVEGFDEEVFHRHIARADGEALDAVEVAVGQRFRAVAAEEGAVLEALVVDERIPRVRHVRIGFAEIEPHDPEIRRRAGLPAFDGEVGCAARMLVARVAVHVLAEVGRVHAVVEGKRGVLRELPLRADADNIRERVEGADIVRRAVRREEAMRVIADRAQIPSGDAEIR